MGITVSAEVQGKHSTGVNVPALRSIVEKKLADVEKDMTLQLHIRQVHIPRYRRNPGVYASAYGTVSPRAIEVLLFGEEPTGRPAVLYVPTDEGMDIVLGALSPRLLASWRLSQQRDRDIGCLNRAANPDKLAERASVRDEATHKKNILSLHRKAIHAHREQIAYDMIRQLKWGISFIHPWFIADIFGIPRDTYYLPDLVLLVEQFGLVEVHNDFGKRQGSVEVTSYAYDLANLRIDELNRKKNEDWQKEFDGIEKKVIRARENEEKYKKLFREARQEKNRYAHELNQHKKKAPKEEAYFKKK